MKGFERRAGIVTADQTLLKILQMPVVGTAILQTRSEAAEGGVGNQRRLERMHVIDTTEKSKWEVLASASEAN